jgi:O-antigen ligase
LCLLLLPTLLALVPRGAAPLAAVAGFCALLMVLRDRAQGLAAVRFPATVFAALVLLGAVSAAWSINPERSLEVAAKLTGMLAAALALGAASLQVAAPLRIGWLVLSGTAVAVVVAGCDFETAGDLSHFVTVRPFAGARLNQIAVWLAVLALPSAALLACRRRIAAAIGAVTVFGATVYVLDGTTAKTALLLSLPVGFLLYFRLRLASRVMAAVSVVAVLSAPLTLPHLDEIPTALPTAYAFKVSAGHRMQIWSFTGDRIAEKPLLGWGLDSSRAIPGGQKEIRPGEKWLPLHPHDAALQVWLELGVPGAVLFALLLAWLWMRLGAAGWPPIYTAAAGASLAAAQIVAFAGWGIWQEWWLGMLGIAAFAVVVMGRAAARSAIRPPPRPPGSPVSGR